jgi:hypothetical protein
LCRRARPPGFVCLCSFPHHVPSALISFFSLHLHGVESIQNKQPFCCKLQSRETLFAAFHLDYRVSTVTVPSPQSVYYRLLFRLGAARPVTITKSWGLLARSSRQIFQGPIIASPLRLKKHITTKTGESSQEPRPSRLLDWGSSVEKVSCVY